MSSAGCTAVVLEAARGLAARLPVLIYGQNPDVKQRNVLMHKEMGGAALTRQSHTDSWTQRRSVGGVAL